MHLYSYHPGRKIDIHLMGRHFTTHTNCFIQESDITDRTGKARGMLGTTGAGSWATWVSFMSSHSYSFTSPTVNNSNQGNKINVGLLGTIIVQTAAE